MKNTNLSKEQMDYLKDDPKLGMTNEKRVEIIKHFEPIVEGFTLVNGGKDLLDPCNASFCLEEQREYFKKIIYPHFLQIAIEGVNKSDDIKYAIHSDEDQMIICDKSKYGNKLYYGVAFIDYGSIAQAKEAALLWIMEREK